MGELLLRKTIRLAGGIMEGYKMRNSSWKDFALLQNCLLYTSRCVSETGVEGETSYKGRSIRVIDTPGIYSLTSYTIEEKVTRRCLEDDEVDVIINVVDASSLERNLYLTLQLLELKKPVILALNMMDIVEERGMELDLHRLPEMLGGIPVVPVSARKRTGLDVLLHAVVHHYEEGPHGVVVKYTPQLEEVISKVESALKREFGDMGNLRWHAIKFMEQDEDCLLYTSGYTGDYPGGYFGCG